MAYNIPSVQVYQELQNAGGVLDSTPDLEGVIIGPAYNILEYVAGSTTSLVKTAATSAASASASTVAGSPILTFTTLPPFSVGDQLLVDGADASGGILAATAQAVVGFVVTMNVNAGVTLATTLVHKQGIIVNPLITNTFNLPSQVPGQIINTASLKVYANQAKIQTLSLSFAGYVGSNALSYVSAAGTTSVTSGSPTASAVTNAAAFSEGDPVLVTGAGPSGADLTTSILTIVGTTFTLANNVGTTLSGAAITRIAASNIDSTTSTLRMEAGDEVSVAYTDTSSVAQIFTTSVLSVTPTTGNFATVALADVLPVGTAAVTTATASIAASATGFTLTSATGFATGDTIIIKGAGAAGGDHEAVIGNLSGAVITGLSPATITTTTGNAVVQKRAKITVRTRKLFNNQLIPAVKPISGGANYVTTNTAVDGTISINPNPEVAYGKLISGEIHIGYKALRTDLSGSVLTINNQDDNLGTFGVVSEENPLALGVQIALANTTSRIRAIAISTDDDAGYLDALDMAESERLYALTVLTQSASIGAALSAHVNQLSTPVEAMWRVGFYNSAIPTSVPVGDYTADFVNANGGNNSITLNTGKYVLTSSNSSFITDGVTPGDLLHITAGTGSPSPIGVMQILTVVSNQQLVVQAQGLATGVSFYVTRNLSKTQRAASVAGTSKTFRTNRICHVQPDRVVVNVAGRNVVLPGYYLAAALVGLTAGNPSQQGFTNFSIAGITDLQNSNFVFTRAQMNTMAEAGTLLYVQETAGSIPYIRHELTTDVSVYEYRELQAVKNWDFLSYYFHDKLTPFIGKWNITPDTIGVIRQTIVAAAELIKNKKLPRIGAPLVDYKILEVAQNAVNKDRLNVRIQTTQPKILNYVDLYLII